jgi:hypothetical protein
MHRMWVDGTEFTWSKKEIAASRATRSAGSRHWAGNDVPAWTMAMMSSTDFICEQSASEQNSI